MTDEHKLLDKLRKLKAHQESAEAIGSEAEAQAFAEKIQNLLLTHDLQMSDIQFEEMEAEQPVGDHYVNYAKHGLKVKKTRVAWMERLASFVARANFCRIIVVTGSSNFYIVGREEHRAVAEYMIVTLTRAVMDISKKEHSKYCWECYKVDGNCERARGFKDAFITGFIVRLFERIEERKKTAEVSTSTALVRINREEAAVEADMNRRKDDKETRKSTSLSISAPQNREGVKRGKAAADNIDLGGKAVTSSGTHRKALV